MIDKSSYLRELYCVYVRSKNKYFLEEVERRRLFDIKDYDEISKPLKSSPFFYIPDCNYYGLLYQLFSFIGVKLDDRNLFDHSIYIEHGIILGDFVDNYNLEKASKGFTFSNFRRNKIMAKHALEILPIGPYIHYVEPLLNLETFCKKKKEFGKVLLVFPSHSIGSIDIEFNIREFCKEIEKRKNHFDTVLVCLYWTDIHDAEEYLSKGYQVTCAGHRDDLYFLNRLKSIILLSDHVITNSVGTHLGYSIFLNKPVYVYEQKIVHTPKFKSDAFDLIYADDAIKQSYEDTENIIGSYFHSWSNTVTQEQINCVSSYFGFDSIKTSDEIKKLLNR